MRPSALSISLVGITAALGCSGRYTILSVPAVSMTTPSLPPGTKASPAGRVEARYCTGDTPIASKDDIVGMMDEAILRAQQKSGAAYLSDVTIQRDGDCIYVNGMAMK
jgi:hypothetical protein